MLGPLHFKIFMNDMLYMNLDCNICNFADDTTLYSCRPSIDIVSTEEESTFTATLCGLTRTGWLPTPVKFPMMFLGKKLILSYI